MRLHLELVLNEKVCAIWIVLVVIVVIPLVALFGVTAVGDGFEILVGLLVIVGIHVCPMLTRPTLWQEKHACCAQKRHDCQ